MVYVRLEEYFGLRRNYWYNNIMIVYSQTQTGNLWGIQEFAMLMGPGGSKMPSPDMGGTVERGTQTIL
ncbi:hypothetical protein F2Q68_00021199 [Brassica cretica]|uniref:Uncharacterized protein n=1 Tax=Brassica cretica TaxID=69181 RepID=A0A8S9G7L2_BRACR|nr:hypothetical protein F2Q68_00021199 [Brassica cretica]